MQLSQQSQSELDIAESLGAILRVKQPYMGSEAQSSYACSKPSTSTMTFAVEPYMNFSRSSCHVASEIASLLPSLQSIPSSSMNLPTPCFATEILVDGYLLHEVALSEAWPTQVDVYDT